jgi:riboflavin kinase / FMN adenylyltransferase
VRKGPLDRAELPQIGPAVLTMGVFDGVHRGHAALLSRTRRVGDARGLPSVALVFDPHPDEVVRPGVAVPRLAPLHVNLERIERELGVTRAVPFRFDDDVRDLEAGEFLASLQSGIVVRSLVMTPGMAFGRNRAGTVDAMRELGRSAGFDVEIVEPLVDGGTEISSSRLREALAGGDLAGVRRLGRPPYLEGVVVEGDHRGRELGYPTANLRFDYTPAMPPLGIYTGRASVPERGVGPGHPALVSIGVRPTFHSEGEALVEVHLLDFDGDLYGATLQLELLDRLRDEMRFADADSLVAQMHRDEAEARRLLGQGRAWEGRF